MNIGYWNVNGYKSKFLVHKFRHPEFLDIIKDCDILGIGEIQSEEQVDIEGFICKKQKIREKISKGPKLSGGVGLYVRKALSHLVEVIPNDYKDSIWVQIKKGESEKSNNIYLGTFYVIPENQKIMFKAINDEINIFSKRGPILVQGDLNARTGSEKDYVDYDENDPLHFGESEGQGYRNSQDKHKNQRGGELNDICKLNDLLISNGRKPGDLFGKYTCHNWNGSSVVDYMISSEYLAKKHHSFLGGELRSLAFRSLYYTDEI